MRQKSLLMAALCTVVIAAVGATSAFAGESTGNFARTGKQTPIGAAPDNAPHAASVCSFSGQNPEAFLDPTDPNSGFEPGRVQNWGHVKNDLRDQVNAETGGHGAAAITDAMHAFGPGVSCNGHTGEAGGA
jgi:hypothetical protein